MRQRRAGPRLDVSVLARALRYASRHRRLAVLAYGSLVVATIAQLIVPQLVRVIIDSVVGGIAVQSDADSVRRALVAAMMEAATEWVRSEGRFKMGDLMKQALDAINADAMLDGLASRKK